MDLHVKLFDISTGDSAVAMITKNAALTYDLHTSDRVVLEANGKSVIATLNTTVSGFGLLDTQIGIFLETSQALGLVGTETVSVFPAPKPASINVIKKKMSGEALTDAEMLSVVKDIVDRKLTQIELTFFVAACSIKPLTMQEIATLTRSMSDTGVKLHFDKKLVIDKHCIGGVPGNRTSMITVPIMASLGYTVPKTSSRAITSPAGTADTMEVLAEVNLSVEHMQRVVNTVGACLVWGGGFNIAPADDRIIRIERPLSIDVPGLMISSVMAKKYSAGSTHVVIDIPFGPTAKVKTIEHAEELRKQFETIGKMLGLKVMIVITDGSQPIGNGVGPLLEAYDVLAVLKNDPAAPHDLLEKSLLIAGKLLEFIGHCPRGKGREIALGEIKSGRAYKKFQEMIDAQGRKQVPALAKYKADILSLGDGMVVGIDNMIISHIARIAGAPISKKAGLLLYAKVGHVVSEGEKLFTIYAENEEKLKNAVDFVKTETPYVLK